MSGDVWRELMVARDTLDRLEDALREDNEFVDRERLLLAWRVTADRECELTREMEG